MTRPPASGYGGAIFQGGGDLTQVNSTLSGNSAERIGGAISSFGAISGSRDFLVVGESCECFVRNRLACYVG